MRARGMGLLAAGVALVVAMPGTAAVADPGDGLVRARALSAGAGLDVIRSTPVDGEFGQSVTTEPKPARAPGSPAAASATAAPSRYIVRLKPGANRAAAVASAKASGKQITRVYRHVFSGMAIRMTAAEAKVMRSDPGVISVIRDKVVRKSATQSGPTWGLDRVDQRALPLNAGYTYSAFGSAVTAYVIDSGIRASHNDFGGRVQGGANWVDDGQGTNDCDGHGTHVAGTIGGSIYGVAKGVNLVPVRVLGCDGTGYTSDVIAGIDWVASHASGPSVANLSLGGSYDADLDAAIEGLVASGVTTVVAAGNDNDDSCNYSPADVSVAITVGATASNDARASFSDYGSCLDIFAPGVSITSAGIASNSATATYSGTSMASPHVAGAAVLYLAGHPTATPAQVQSALIAASTKNKVTSPGDGSPNRLLFVDSTPLPTTVLPVGASATPIALPLNDGVSDASTVTVASAVLAPGTAAGSSRTFSIDGTAGADPTFTVSPTRRSIDAREPCDPVAVTPVSDCPSVQDVWTFVWDGKAEGGDAVEVGDYAIVEAAVSIGTVQVRNLELASIAADRTAPLVVAPYADGKLDTLQLNVRGLTNGATAQATTGSAELTDPTGAILVDRVDFDPTPAAAHDIELSLSGQAYGSYLLTVTLEANGVTVSKGFAVSLVRTEVLSSRIALSQNLLYPYADSYLDSTRVTVSTVTSIGALIDTTGTVDVYRGTTKVRTLALGRGQTAVVWDGKVGGRTVPGTYLVRATVKGPQGSARTSASASVVVRITAATGASITPSASTVYPVGDGYIDTVSLTARASSNTGRVVRGSLTISVLRGSRVVKNWVYSTTAGRSVTWNGRVGSSVDPGTYTLRVTARGPEGASVVRTRSIAVSGKRLVTVTTSGTRTVTAQYARDDCGGGGYRTCDDGYFGDIGGTNYNSITWYYTGAYSDDYMFSAHSVPIPSGATRFRIRVVARTYDASYVLGVCDSDASNPDDCPDGEGIRFATYDSGTFDAGWHTTGASDGSADFFIGTVDWGSIYIARFIVDYQVTRRVLQ